MVETTRRRSRQLGFALTREPWQGLHAERKTTVFCKGRGNKANPPPNETREKYKVSSGWAGRGTPAGPWFCGMEQCCSLNVRGDFGEPARHGTGPSTSSGRTGSSGHRWAWGCRGARGRPRFYLKIYKFLQRGRLKMHPDGAFGGYRPCVLLKNLRFCQVGPAPGRLRPHRAANAALRGRTGRS